MRTYIAFLVLALCLVAASAKPSGGKRDRHDRRGGDRHGGADMTDGKRGGGKMSKGGREKPRPDRPGRRGDRGHEHQSDVTMSPECMALNCERPTKDSWVCGSDDMTYRSECLLMKDICKGRVAAEVTVASPGKCEGADGRPVKPSRGEGKDGRRPEKGKGGRRPHGKKDRPHKERLPKECFDFIDTTMEPILMEDEEPVCTAACPINTAENPVQQVCGSDGITYASQCVLELTACITENTELIMASEGTCSLQ